MRLEDLLKPISPDDPCGENLLDADDPDFVDYYFNVEDRLPSSYFNMVQGTLFDSKSVDWKAEAAQIDALLKRSRDLRLLGIEAKFQILAGRFKGFAEAVLGMAGLLEAYPEEVNPRDPVDRRNAIEELDALATIVAPLDYATLITDRRQGDVTYRPYGTGTGKIDPRANETAGEPGPILAALGSSENQAAVDQLFAQLTDLRAALQTMTTASQKGANPFTPRFARLAPKLDEMREMVLAARSDLAGEVAAPEVEGEATSEPGTAPQVSGGGASTTITLNAANADVPDQRAAFRLLSAVERYFAQTEPASLALLLTTQSKLLIGRPLVEALDALIESSAGYASITFGTEHGFTIPMARMRELSNNANIPTTEDLTSPQEGDPEPPEILSRDHAGLVIKQVEDFYRQREPASPIPILLFKARNLLSKDFHALVRELLPQQG